MDNFVTIIEDVCVAPSPVFTRVYAHRLKNRFSRKETVALDPVQTGRWFDCSRCSCAALRFSKFCPRFQTLDLF